MRKDSPREQKLIITSADSGKATNSRVVSWRPLVVDVAISSQTLDDLKSLMQNKLEHGDHDAYRYNAKRFFDQMEELVNASLQELTDAERIKRKRLESACYLVGTLAVVCAPLNALGIMLPAAVSLLVVAGLRWRVKQRIRTILSLRLARAKDRANRFDAFAAVDALDVSCERRFR